MENFRKKIRMCDKCFYLGLPARIYRTWASLITQIHGGYVAESVFGYGSVHMSEELDHSGADFQVRYKDKILNYQVKKETMSREVRTAKKSKTKIDGDFIDIKYNVPSGDYFDNPKKLNGEFKTPYLRFIEDKTALIFYFNYPKIMTRQGYVAGSFAFSCFAGDVFSEKINFPQRMSKESREEMLNKKPSDFYLYDIKEKKFTKSLAQKEWYGIDVTRKFMENVGVSEGLDGYNAIKWINHSLQQKDLLFLNELLLSKKNVLDSVKDYAGWNVLWNNLTPNRTIAQRSLF